MPKIKIGYAEDYNGATRKYKILGRLENQDVLAVQPITSGKPYFLTGPVELMQESRVHDVEGEEGI